MWDKFKSQFVGNGVFKSNERFINSVIVLVVLMFYQNWKLALFALIMMPLAVIVCKIFRQKN